MNEVLIIADDPLVIDSMRKQIARASPLAIVTVCGDDATAIKNLSDPTKRWHRIFLNLDIPGACGLSLARKIQTHGLQAVTCIVTRVNRDDYIAQSRAMGLLGYVVGYRSIEEFFEALLKVFNGECVFPSKAPATRLKDEIVRITRSHKHILELVSRGLSSKRIGLRLFLTEGTVNNHINEAMARLKARSRTHAVFRAFELGMIDLGAQD